MLRAPQKRQHHHLQPEKHRMLIFCKIASTLYAASGSNPGLPGLGRAHAFLFWQWARWYLRFLELSTCGADVRWNGFFKSRGITPKTYDKRHVLTPIASYVRKSAEYPDYTYTGSTADTTPNREATRFRTFRCVDEKAEGETNNAEPAILWWSQTKSFF